MVGENFGNTGVSSVKKIDTISTVIKKFVKCARVVKELELLENWIFKYILNVLF